MRCRLVCALGASIALVVACGGGAFTSADGDGGSSGSGAESGSSAGGKSSSGGKGSQGGSGVVGGAVSVAGNGSGGDVTSGGTSPGGGVVGVAGNGGMAGTTPVAACDEPSDCDVDSLCAEPTCSSHECGSKPIADGPYKLQVPGDCQRMDCVDGKETLVVDIDDYDDNNECTSDSCYQNGTQRHEVHFSQVCGNGGGLCNAAGKCEMCNLDACPAATACHGPVCSGGQCQLAPKPAGELCNPTPNEPDTYDQCDGNGNCVDCVTSGGCGECCVCGVNQTCQEA